MSDNNQNRIQMKLAKLVEASIDVSTCAVEGEKYKGRKITSMQAGVAAQIVRAMSPKVQSGGVGGLHVHLNVPRPGEVKTLKDSAPIKSIEAVTKDPLLDESSYSKANGINNH